MKEAGTGTRVVISLSVVLFDRQCQDSPQLQPICISNDWWTGSPLLSRHTVVHGDRDLPHVICWILSAAIVDIK